MLQGNESNVMRLDMGVLGPPVERFVIYIHPVCSLGRWLEWSAIFGQGHSHRSRSKQASSHSSAATDPSYVFKQNSRSAAGGSLLLQGIRMKYETRRELRYGQQIAKHWKRRRRRIYSNNFCASFIAAGSSINMAGRRGDTARFDTQYPECYGLTGRDREESRLSLLVRYFLSRLVHYYPHARTFPAPKREHICIHRRPPLITITSRHFLPMKSTNRFNIAEEIIS